MRNNYKGEEHNELPRDLTGGRSSLSSPHQSSPTQLQCVKTQNTSNHRQRTTDKWDKLADDRVAVSATAGNSENRSVSADLLFA
jgi:hypothetical protein